MVSQRPDAVEEAPSITDPSQRFAEPEELEPILDALLDAEPAAEQAIYRRGTFRPDGTVDLCKQGLGPDGARSVIGAAAANPRVRHLLLGTNGLGAGGTAALAAATGSEHSLETLYLGCNWIDGDALEPLTTALRDDTTVRSLWLKRNPLGVDGAVCLGTMLASNSTIRTLDLVSTSLDHRALDALLDGLRSNPDSALERLYLGGNHFGERDATIIGELVAVCPSLRFLSVAPNPIGDDGFRVLADRVSVLDRPVGLGMSNCGLGPGAAGGLRAAASFATQLDLGPRPDWAASGGVRNGVGDPSAVALAEMVGHGNSPLRTLSLVANGVTSRGAGALAEALELGHHQLHDVQIGKGVATSLRRRIRQALVAAPPSEPDDLSVIRSRYR